MDIKIKLKQKSVLQFFSENLIGYNSEQIHSHRNEMDCIYGLIKDEIFLKKTTVEVGELVSFELSDRTCMTGKDIKNNYVYRVEAYDDISVKLVLIHSDIKLQ